MVERRPIDIYWIVRQAEDAGRQQALEDQRNGIQRLDLERCFRHASATSGIWRYIYQVGRAEETSIEYAWRRGYVQAYGKGKERQEAR